MDPCITGNRVLGGVYLAFREESGKHFYSQPVSHGQKQILNSPPEPSQFVSTDSLLLVSLFSQGWPCVQSEKGREGALSVLSPMWWKRLHRGTRRRVLKIKLLLAVSHTSLSTTSLFSFTYSMSYREHLRFWNKLTFFPQMRGGSPLDEGGAAQTAPFSASGFSGDWPCLTPPGVRPACMEKEPWWPVLNSAKSSCQLKWSLVCREIRTEGALGQTLELCPGSEVTGCMRLWALHVGHSTEDSEWCTLGEIVRFTSGALHGRKGAMKKVCIYRV